MFLVGKTITIYMNVVFFVVAFNKNRINDYYCDKEFECKKDGIVITNVACEYKPCLPTYMCGRRHKRFNWTDSEKEYITDLHNKLRNRLASGMETRGGNGQAANMKVMSYDNELEFMAVCWANQCYDSNVPSEGRDECRSTCKFQSPRGVQYYEHKRGRTTVPICSAFQTQRAKPLVDSLQEPIELWRPQVFQRRHGRVVLGRERNGRESHRQFPFERRRIVRILHADVLGRVFLGGVRSDAVQRAKMDGRKHRVQLRTGWEHRRRAGLPEREALHPTEGAEEERELHVAVRDDKTAHR